jgi:UDP-N-acetylmuramoyl-tripeptide--D-alanyl-D-alanine ligase
VSAVWHKDALAGALGAEVIGGGADVSGLSIDTRTLQRGDLFVALKDVRDGHEFVAQAFAAGAAAALVDRVHAPQLAGLGPLYVVEAVLPALERLGRAARARMNGRVMAVTGSVGKTSTKEMLRTIFAAQGPTHASVASYNNHWGVPLTLSRMPAETAFGIFEIGMNHSFEILPLTGMVRPEVAIVTTVEPVHLAQFPGIEAIADAKGEIFAGLMPGGVAVINRDIPQFERLKAHAGASPAGRIVSFGAHDKADVRLLRVNCAADESAVEADVLGRRVHYRLGTPGRHMVQNSLAVMAAVRLLGADLDRAAASMADVVPADGRGRRLSLSVPGGTLTLLDEAYNANPSSMRAALAVLASLSVGPGGRRIAILGDMLELGPAGPGLHAGLAEAIENQGIDLVFAAGPLMKNLVDALPKARVGGYAADSSALEPMVLDAIRSGDVVTVKGSNGSRMARIVAALKARHPAVDAGAETMRG